MTKIRLARFGSRHQPHYRIVVTDSRSRRDGRFIEMLGSYNPGTGAVKLNKERAEYWISVGAQPTNTTISLLTKGDVKHSFKVAKKPFRKKEEAVAEQAEAAEPAEGESTDEAAPAEDTPAENTDQPSETAEAEAEESAKS